MGFVIDLILILAFAAVIIVSYKKGVVRSIVDSFGVLIAVFSASKIAQYSHLWIYENFFREKLIESVKRELFLSGEAETLEQIKLAFIDIKESLIEFSSIAGLDTKDITEKVNSIDLSAENAAEVFTDIAIQPIMTIIISCVIFLISAVLLIIVLLLLSRCLTKVIDKTPLNGPNKFFGAVFGVIKGSVTVLLLSLLIVLLATVVENDGFDSTVESSRIISVLIPQVIL